MALLTTLLDKRMAFHRAVLVEKLVAGDWRTTERIAMYARGLAAKGLPFGEAHRTAVALLDGLINQQSAVMSFGDTFLVTAALLVATVPLIFLGRPTAGAAAPAGH